MLCLAHNFLVLQKVWVLADLREVLIEWFLVEHRLQVLCQVLEVIDETLSEFLNGMLGLNDVVNLFFRQVFSFVLWQVLVRNGFHPDVDH